MNADIKPTAGSDDLSAARNPEPAPANLAHMPGSYDPGEQANGNGRDDDVLDVEGATRLLRIGRNTIYELVGRNEIPHRRLGKQIRFSRAAIMRWLDPWSSQDAKKGH